MTDDEIVRGILKAEGSTYTDDPADGGGPTKFGITLEALRQWRRRPTGAADVEALTQEEVEAIYRSVYIMPCDRLPEPLRETTIHVCVLRGTRSGIMMLQGILNVTVDGWVGTETLAAITKRGPRVWNALLAGAMLHHCALRVKAMPSQQRFRAGWQQRMLALALKD